jgi:hypothetical protein
MDQEDNGKSLFDHLLDLLLVVAENFKLLILGPVVIGLLAFAISYAFPLRFASQAILALPTSPPTSTLMSTPIQTPAQAAAMMISPLVLDSVIGSLNLADGHSIEGARLKLASQIKAKTGKEGLLWLDVTANTSVQAQAIANAIIDTWLKSTVPVAQDRADLEKRLSYAKTSLASVSHLLDRLAAGGTTILNKPLTLGDAGTSIVAVGELQTRYLADVLNIPRLMQGWSRDIVLQPPTLPAEPAAPKKGLIAVLAALGSGFALLLWMFMQQAWKNASRDPEVAERQAKLRAAVRSSVRTH